MRSRVSDHLRTNVVGYVALFLVVTGGTAYALDGANTVFSDDIVDGQVKTADLHDDAVTSPKVTDGSLGGADLANRSIGGQKVGVETLAGVNVSDGSLFGADIANESLGAADIGGGAIGTSELNAGAFEPSDIARKSLSDPRFGIASNSIQGAEVSDNTLTNADISESTLDTPEAAYSKTDGSINLPDGSDYEIANRRVEPGSYVVLVKASLSSSGGEFVSCRLDAVLSGTTPTIDEVRNPTVKMSAGLPGAYDQMSMLGVVSSGDPIRFIAYCHGAGVRLDHIRLVAIKVNRLIATDAP